jgi:hypothetical protein
MKTARVVALIMLMVLPAMAGQVLYEHTWPAFTSDSEEGTVVTYTVSFREVGASDTTHVGIYIDDGATEYVSDAFLLTEGMDYDITVWGHAALPSGEHLYDHCTDREHVDSFHHNGCNCRRVNTRID